MILKTVVTDVTQTKIEKFFDLTALAMSVIGSIDHDVVIELLNNYLGMCVTDVIMQQFTPVNWCYNYNIDTAIYYYEQRKAETDVEIIVQVRNGLISVIRLLTDINTEVATATLWHNHFNIKAELDTLNIEYGNIVSPDLEHQITYLPPNQHPSKELGKKLTAILNTTFNMTVDTIVVGLTNNNTITVGDKTGPIQIIFNTNLTGSASIIIDEETKTLLPCTCVITTKVDSDLMSLYEKLLGLKMGPFV